jgi:large subunit ribosomal protein L6
MTTSRIGRMPVSIPTGVEVMVQDLNLSAKGPKGQAVVSLHSLVRVSIENGEIKIRLNDDGNEVITGVGTKLLRSICGTTRANIYNAVHGVAHGFERKLILVGVGYKAQSKGKVLSLSLGFSHPTEFSVPEGITIETPIPTEIIIKGISKELVGKTAAKIRSIRSPEPYKGKGVRYSDEVIELKETKKK